MAEFDVAIAPADVTSHVTEHIMFEDSSMVAVDDVHDLAILRTMDPETFAALMRMVRRFVLEQAMLEA